MTRTIEHIVEVYWLAMQRRVAGQPIWAHRINIREILHRDPDNESPEHAAAVGNEIAALLRAKLPASMFDVTSNDYDRDIDEIVEVLKDLNVEEALDGPDSVFEELNGRLEELYDWADIQRVWLGP